MSSCLWFSHRVCPSQLPSHPSCLPVSSFLHSWTHWGQHLDCAKCLPCVRNVCVCVHTAFPRTLFWSAVLYNDPEVHKPRSESPRCPAGRFSWHVKLDSTSRQSVTSGAGWCKCQLKLATSSVDVMGQQQLWWWQRRCGVGGTDQLRVGAKGTGGWRKTFEHFCLERNTEGIK